MITFAIGDIHGCYEKLVALVGKCREYADRGPDSKKVIEYVRAEGFICLRGNHEQMMVDAATKASPSLWIRNGGDATLRSFEVNFPAHLPQEIIDWANSLLYFYQDEHRIYVHAGLEVGVPLERQSPSFLMWSRGEFLASDYDWGKLIVHGHTPTKYEVLHAGVSLPENPGKEWDPAIRSNRVNLDTGAVFGGYLTAGVFLDSKREMETFIQV